MTALRRNVCASPHLCDVYCCRKGEKRRSDTGAATPLFFELWLNTVRLTPSRPWVSCVAGAVPGERSPPQVTSPFARRLTRVLWDWLSWALATGFVVGSRYDFEL